MFLVDSGVQVEIYLWIFLSLLKVGTFTIARRLEIANLPKFCFCQTSVNSDIYRIFAIDRRLSIDTPILK